MLTTLKPPYNLHYKAGDYTSVDMSRGTLYSSQFMLYAGSFQNLAAVGSTFNGPAGSQRIRVEATINVPYYRVWTPAFIGYASSEVILNLRVLDGSQTVGHDRRSVARAIAVIFWNTELKGSTRFTLAKEFTGGGGREYSAWVELETWVGAGGLVAGASATGNVSVEQLVIRTV